MAIFVFRNSNGWSENQKEVGLPILQQRAKREFLVTYFAGQITNLAIVDDGQWTERGVVSPLNSWALFSPSHFARVRMAGRQPDMRSGSALDPYQHLVSWMHSTYYVRDRHSELAGPTGVRLLRNSVDDIRDAKGKQVYIDLNFSWEVELPDTWLYPAIGPPPLPTNAPTRPPHYAPLPTYAPPPTHARLLTDAPPPTWELELPTEWLYPGPALGPPRSLTHAPPLTPAFLLTPALPPASAPLPAPAPLLTFAPMKPDFRHRRVSCEYPGCSVGSTWI